MFQLRLLLLVAFLLHFAQSTHPFYKALTVKNKPCVTACDHHGYSYIWCYTAWKEWDYCAKSFDPRNMMKLSMAEHGIPCVSLCTDSGNHGYEWCFTGINNQWGKCSSARQWAITEAPKPKPTPAPKAAAEDEYDDDDDDEK